jgi:hypothetical protein
VTSPHRPVEPRTPTSASLSPAASATTSPVLLASMDHRGRGLFFHPSRSGDLHTGFLSRRSHETPSPLPHVLRLGSQLVGSLADRVSYAEISLLQRVHRVKTPQHHRSTVLVPAGRHRPGLRMENPRRPLVKRKSLGWIRIRIRIRGSMPLTNGSGSGFGSGSCYFRH